MTPALIEPLSGQELLRLMVSLLTAAVLGGAIGWERRSAGKSAGLRTHMLVALGAAVFVQCINVGGESLSRVIQGVAAGIGFIGAGAILKHNDDGYVEGLTTAASVWLTASVGVAAGVGRIWPAVLGTGLALIALMGLGVLEKRLDRRPPTSTNSVDSNP